LGLVGLSAICSLGSGLRNPARLTPGKGVLVNRIGDFGMMLGILLLCRTRTRSTLMNCSKHCRRLACPPGTATLIAALIFLRGGRKKRAGAGCTCGVAGCDGGSDAGCRH